MGIRPINPVARVIAQNRRRTSTRIAQPKKGKGSYNRKNKEKEPHGGTERPTRL